MTLRYKLLNQNGRARRGVVRMPRGDIQTPVFMPVGTAATVKGMFPRDLKELGTEISLANTYHLHIQPGEKLVEKAGGLHDFMAMDWPILTDSGGFQVFSLPRKEITEQGVEFQFKKGADPIFASPEWSMNVQQALGADIIMAFDECPPYPATHEYADRSLERTLRWLDRCVEAKHRDDQYLFGIVQGSIYADLRKRSAEETTRRNLPGYAIGGVSVGEGHNLMMKAIDDAEPFMPTDKPRYLMGVGLPEDIVGAVGRGMDMFDCVIPTRYGRSGTCFTTQGRIRLTQRRYRNDMYPIDPACSCYACQNYSRAYIHHLMQGGELLGTMLTTLHNVAHYHQLMREIRAAIEANDYLGFTQRFFESYLVPDRERRKDPIPSNWFDSFELGAALLLEDPNAGKGSCPAAYASATLSGDDEPPSKPKRSGGGTRKERRPPRQSAPSNHEERPSRQSASGKRDTPPAKPRFKRSTKRRRR